MRYDPRLFGQRNGDLVYQFGRGGKPYAVFTATNLLRGSGAVCLSFAVRRTAALPVMHRATWPSTHKAGSFTR